MEVAPPPEPVVPRPRKRCSHDYCDKWRCPLCNPCPGGHGKRKAQCGICNGTVLERDGAPPPNELLQQPFPAAPDQKCGHTYLDADNKHRSYGNKRLCPVCSNCGHKRTKGNCSICNDCGHGKLKRNCKICDPCPHGYSKNNCRFHSSLPIVLGNA